ncbi:MAG: N-acetyl-gamma-glutamyl-phosphate reductase [Azospirillaceae bacterium]
MPKVFIDGEAGTTGLQILDRLQGRTDIELIRLDEARRKDDAARHEALNAADVAILCLPDEAARDAVAMIDNPTTRVIDASTAHRTAEGWHYGFPEMDPDHRDAIAGSTRIANPGCYPTGAIALLRPLVRAGIVPTDYPATVNAISGYSGGGKALINRFEAEGDETPFYLYALSLKHKHLPEMQRWCGLKHAPVFMPSVGRFRQGMLVSVPLHLSALPGSPAIADMVEIWRAHYAGARFVEVVGAAEAAGMAELEPQALNGSNRLCLHAFGSEDGSQAVLVAQLDNLGKGASGAAVQNLNLSLGLDEAEGLTERLSEAA